MGDELVFHGVEYLRSIRSFTYLRDGEVTVSSLMGVGAAAVELEGEKGEVFGGQEGEESFETVGLAR